MINVGNKAPGGGSEVTATASSITIDGVTTQLDAGSTVTTDGSSITIDGVTTPIAASDPTEGGTKLRRVDTGAWEAAQTGVEYYSPDQRGGVYGMVYRQYYTGTTGAASVTVDSGFHTAKRFIAQEGVVIDTASGSTLTLPIYFGAVSNAGCNDNGTDLVLIVGSGFDDANDTYRALIDYYKV